LSSPLRDAIYAEKHREVLRLIRDGATPDENGCWIWPTVGRYGYPILKGEKGFSGHRRALHRVVAESNRREPIQPGQHVHHTCGTRACVAPRHLQVIDARDNVAEMRERRAYQAALSKAVKRLRKYNPDDPVAAQIERLIT
jgi:hypothetical protein